MFIINYFKQIVIYTLKAQSRDLQNVLFLENTICSGEGTLVSLMKCLLGGGEGYKHMNRRLTIEERDYIMV